MPRKKKTTTPKQVLPAGHPISATHKNFEIERTPNSQFRIELREALPLFLEGIFEHRCELGRSGKKPYTLSWLTNQRKYKAWEIDFFRSYCSSHHLLIASPRFRNRNKIHEVSLELLNSFLLKLYETVHTPTSNFLKLVPGKNYNEKLLNEMKCCEKEFEKIFFCRPFL